MRERSNLVSPARRTQTGGPRDEQHEIGILGYPRGNTRIQGPARIVIRAYKHPSAGCRVRARHKEQVWHLDVIDCGLLSLQDAPESVVTVLSRVACRVSVVLACEFRGSDR
jgi:hypothetical protein